MKKMLLATALALLVQDVLNRRLLFKKQTGSSSTKETITHHFFVSGIGQKASCSQNLLAAQKMLLKRSSKHS